MRRPIALFAALFALALASCTVGNGTSNDPYSLVGTWISTTSGSSNNDSFVDTVEVTFSSNGRYFKSYYDRETSGGLTDVKTSTEGGTWQTSGSRLYMTYPTIDGDATDTLTYSISGDYLTTRYLDGTGATEFMRW